MKFALTYHVEAPHSRPSAEVYAEIGDQVALADELGYHYAWFAEHHAHVHLGHLPFPLLLALHLAGRTRQIHLGTAVICLNMHPAIAIAEQIAVADHLSEGRISPGFGSGSTPEELSLYGLPNVDTLTRHSDFEQSLQVIRETWNASGPASVLPRARPGLVARSWVAANSVEAAGIAARGGHNMMFSFLRTPEQYGTLYDAYRNRGGRGSIAANRPVYVGVDDATAWREAEPALRILWRRFVNEGKIPRERPEPAVFTLENAPGQFLVGGPETVTAFIRDLRERVPFDTFNLEPRWDGLSAAQVQLNLRRFAEQVIPAFHS